MRKTLTAAAVLVAALATLAAIAVASPVSAKLLGEWNWWLPAGSNGCHTQISIVQKCISNEEAT